MYIYFKRGVTPSQFQKTPMMMYPRLTVEQPFHKGTLLMLASSQSPPDFTPN